MWEANLNFKFFKYVDFLPWRNGVLIFSSIFCSKTTNKLYASLNCYLFPVLFYFEILNHRASFVMYCYPCITGMFRLSSRALARAWRYTCLYVHMHVPEVIHASMFTCMCLKVSIPLCVRAWRYPYLCVHMYVPEGIHITMSTCSCLKVSMPLLAKKTLIKNLDFLITFQRISLLMLYFMCMYNVCINRSDFIRFC